MWFPTRLQYGIIRNTDEGLKRLYKRVLDCAKGAAVASGAILDTVTVLTAIHQRHSQQRYGRNNPERILNLSVCRNGLNRSSFLQNLFRKELGRKGDRLSF